MRSAGAFRAPAASLSVVFRSVREALQAGTRPNSRPVRIEMPKVKASTGVSTCMCCSMGNMSGTMLRSRRTPHTASASPSAPPPSASTRLSVNNCRMRRRRPAPKAPRMAISLSRVAARARSRLARLAQAISNSTPTAPSRISSTGRMRPANISAMGNRIVPVPALVAGYCFSRRAAITAISARAWATVTPGFKRATTP